MSGLGHAQSSARDAPQADVIRLGIPYPITGPYEIQAAERATRRYRVVAAHAVPPISDFLAQTIANALASGGYRRVERERRTGLAAFEADEREGGAKRARPVHLLLAGDDVVRSEDIRRLGMKAGDGPPHRLLDPIALMPFVLICSAAHCGNARPRSRDDEGYDAPRFELMSFGSAGERSTSHHAAERLLAAYKLKSLLVPYNGGSTLLGAVVAGEVDAAFVALPLALGYLGQSKLRALGIAAERRFEALPMLPTLDEAGIAPVIAQGWFALFGTSRLRPQDAAEIGPSVRTYLLKPAIRAQLLARGLEPVEATTSRFEALMADDRSRWLARIRAAH